LCAREIPWGKNESSFAYPAAYSALRSKEEIRSISSRVEPRSIRLCAMAQRRFLVLSIEGGNDEFLRKKKIVR